MLALALCSVTSLVPVSRTGEEWNRFRGPSGAGLAPAAAHLPDALDPDKNLLWSTELPPGHSSPCLTEACAFVTGCKDGELRTVCVDRRDGKILWQRALKPAALERDEE